MRKDEVPQRSTIDPSIERLEKPFEAGELQQKIRDALGAALLSREPTHAGATAS